MRCSFLKAFACAFVLLPLSAVVAQADVILDATDLVGTAVVAPPSEHAFTVTTAQPLTITVNDFQTPAAFVSLQIGVTLGDVLIGQASVDPNTHTASLSVTGDVGNYVLHVIGAPDTTQNLGSFGVCVAAATTPTTCLSDYSFSGTIQTPASPSSTPSSALSTNFTSTTAGVYNVTITDDQFPVALQSISGGIAAGSQPVAALAAGSNSVTLAAGTNYSLIIGALADANAAAGLYGVQITDPTGVVVFGRTLPVAGLAASTSVNNPTSQSIGLSLTDFAYPTALAGVGVALTQGGTAPLAMLTLPGVISNVTAPAGNVEIWQYATASSQPGVYSLSITTSTATLFSATNVVNPSGSTSTTQSYAFAVNLPAAGNYNLLVADLQFPASLQSIASTVAQNGSPLQVSDAGVFAAAAGYVIVVVNAAPPTSGEGIFGVTVQSSGGSQIVFDQTQAVGGVFATRTVTLGVAGDFDVTLTDLGFPTTFQSLAVAVSRGGQLLGKVYGGGPLTLAATPGDYILTFVATPGAQSYGLYAIRMASSAPTVTLSAASSTVTAGQSVQLTWSTTDATACTASGTTAWTGSEALSGTLAVAIPATSTLTLSCTGAGGSASQSVNVTATATASSGGGGGALDIEWLSLLAALWSCGLWRARSAMSRN